MRHTPHIRRGYLQFINSCSWKQANYFVHYSCSMLQVKSTEYCNKPISALNTVTTVLETVFLVIYVTALQRFFGLKVKQSHYRRLRLPDFKTVGTRRWKGCQPYAPAICTPQEIFLVLIYVRSWVNQVPQCGRTDYVNEKFQWHHRESNPPPSD